MLFYDFPHTCCCKTKTTSCAKSGESPTSKWISEGSEKSKGRFTFGHVQLRDYHGIFLEGVCFCAGFFIEAVAFPEHGHQ